MSATVSPTEVALADELVATIRKWVAAVVIPGASEYEHADEYPEPFVEQMKEFGLFGARIAPEHGGLGLDTVTYRGSWRSWRTGGCRSPACSTRT